MKRYIIRYTFDGDTLEAFGTEEEALDALFMHEMTDISEGTFEKGTYEVYDSVSGNVIEL